jgi:CDP-glycerol glycerophosphotransferase
MEELLRANWSRYAQNHAEAILSIVIPVYNVQAYLTACLDSITEQKLEDIEIVVVDGASTDDLAEILWQRSAHDPRITAIRTDRIGPGRARNLGAELAMGQYVWFVDGDDAVAPDCLTAVADRLEILRPDVLLLDHEERLPDGTVEASSGHELIARDTEACFALAEHPWVTELTMAAWNKVIRRDFFLSQPVKFLPDWPHEDVPVSCLLLVDAAKLSLLKQVCYRHTLYRAGSAMAEAGKRHFNILAAYELVLGMIQSRFDAHDPDVTAAIRLAFFQRAIWHYTTIFDAGPLMVGDFIANADRREFYTRMHENFVRFVPLGYRYPRGLRGLKFRMIKRNAYWIYSILSPVNKLRVRTIRRGSS